MDMDDESSGVSSGESSDSDSDTESRDTAASRSPSLTMSSPAPPTPMSPRARDDPHPAVHIQLSSTPLAPPSTSKTKPLVTAKPAIPFVRRSGRIVRPTSDVVLRDTSPSDSDDSGGDSDFQPKPCTPPPKRGGGARPRSSIPAVAPPTPKSPTVARKWPKRDGEARQLQNKAAQAKYRHKKKAIFDAVSAASTSCV